MSLPATSGTSSLQATAAMCMYCFDVLQKKFETSESSIPDFDGVDPTVQCPLFVTLHTVEGHQKNLRGCIGTLSRTHLSTSLQSYTISSAFQDSRFKPLRHTELPMLELSVSLLIDYEVGEHFLDWEVGVHGVIVEFIVDRRRYNATYLPEVAKEQGWNQEEAIHSLIRKSGYRGEINQKLLSSISLTKYQSSKYSVSYREYVDCR